MSNDVITNDDAIITADALISDIQFVIHNLMEAKGYSRTDLARALDVSDARISDLFDDEPKNLTLCLIMQICVILTAL